MQDVVGLGGSAGSIEAVKTFFTYMLEDSGLAFVVVLHLSPRYESSLEGVLQKWKAMPVIRVSQPSVGTDTPKLFATSRGGVPPANGFLAA